MMVLCVQVWLPGRINMSVYLIIYTMAPIDIVITCTLAWHLDVV